VTVRCPRCGTLYRPPARPGPEATYRCARCRHVFATGGAPDADFPDDDEPAFTFEADDEQVPDTGEEDEPARESGQRRPTVEPRPARAPTAPAASVRVRTVRFAFWGAAGVSAAYAVLSIYLYTHPDVANRALDAIPLVGSTLVEARLNPTNVQLTNVRGEYQRVKGDHLVFTITGTAVNQSPAPVRGIQVEGRITGSQEQRRLVFCGAAPRDVRDLSLREIALLQTLEPPREWSLGPGEGAAFLVVFAEPPTDLREFGAEVVAVRAKRERERSGDRQATSRPSPSPPASPHPPGG